MEVVWYLHFDDYLSWIAFNCVW